ncbi:MAG: ABC transporter ATP-binding protein [Alphaproteobacteria bacterium]|nr:ABC transporter ATP-binding protein [Alphaproteobacteria bacterium]
MLEVSDMHVAYGDAPALRGVSLRVGPGELVSVVGPNGAGKTTLVNAILRLLPIRQGTVRLDGADVTAADARAMRLRGVSLIPEGRRLFATMSVEENLEMGCYPPSARRYRDEEIARVYGMFPRLKERYRQQAGTLSGGEQQMVAIGRAMMARPRLLLIDEPSLGLAPAIVEQVFETIRAIHAGGLSILLIEQNAARALAIAARGYVLEDGKVVAEGPADALMAEPQIRAAYLGEGDAGDPREGGER